MGNVTEKKGKSRDYESQMLEGDKKIDTIDQYSPELAKNHHNKPQSQHPEDITDI